MAMIDSLERNLKTVQLEKQMREAETQVGIDPVSVAADLLKSKGYQITNADSQLAAINEIEDLKSTVHNLRRELADAHEQRRYGAGPNHNKLILHPKYAVDSFYVDDYYRGKMTLDEKDSLKESIYRGLTYEMTKEMMPKLNISKYDSYADHMCIFHTKVVVEFLGENDAFNKHRFASQYNQAPSRVGPGIINSNWIV